AASRRQRCGLAGKSPGHDPSPGFFPGVQVSARRHRYVSAHDPGPFAAARHCPALHPVGRAAVA
nr:hypothetical protein [Tanacetum cinerariifolium]